MISGKKSHCWRNETPNFAERLEAPPRLPAGELSAQASLCHPRASLQDARGPHRRDGRSGLGRSPGVLPAGRGAEAVAVPGLHGQRHAGGGRVGPGHGAGGRAAVGAGQRPAVAGGGPQALGQRQDAAGRRSEERHGPGAAAGAPAALGVGAGGQDGRAARGDQGAQGGCGAAEAAAGGGAEEQEQPPAAGEEPAAAAPGREEGDLGREPAPSLEPGPPGAGARRVALPLSPQQPRQGPGWSPPTTTTAPDVGRGGTVSVRSGSSSRRPRSRSPFPARPSRTGTALASESTPALHG